MGNLKANLAAALAEQAGSTRRKAEPPIPTPTQERYEAPGPRQQPSREGTAPITGHFPKEVRRQLKGLANEQDRTMHDLVAEALNDLFQKHNKAEICPRSKAT